MKIILFLSILFVQFHSTQYLSLLLLFSVLGWVIIKNLLTVKKIRKKSLWLLLLWSLMIIIMIRPEYLQLIETRTEIFWLLLGCLSFLIVSFGSKTERISAIKTIVLSGIFGALINLITHTLSWFPEGITNLPYAGTRWVGGFDGPNEFGAFYVMMLALVLGMYLEKEYNLFQMTIRTGVFIPLVYFSYSRGSLLGLVILMAIFVVYSIIKTKRKFLLTSSYLIAFLVFINQYLQPLLRKFNDVRENATDRDNLFSESFRLLKENPIIGHGLGSFEELSFVRNTTPHSDYLLFIVSGGVVGIGMLLYFYFKFIIKAFKDRIYPEFLLLLVFMSQAFTFNNIVRGRLSILFWVVVILIYLGTKVEPKERKEKRLFKKYKLTW